MADHGDSPRRLQRCLGSTQFLWVPGTHELELSTEQLAVLPATKETDLTALTKTSDEFVFTLFTHEVAALFVATTISAPAAFATGWSNRGRLLHPLVGLNGTTN